MGRIAALDFGMKRIGLAITDERKKIALPLKTVEGGKEAIGNVRAALSQMQVELLLVGLPLLMNGKEGDMAQAVRKFGAELEAALKIPVEYIDERLTSKMADRALREISLNRKDRTEKMDTAAAMQLLQTYLDRPQ